jgi:methylthioribulose-1-phosphate dehydratase
MANSLEKVVEHAKDFDRRGWLMATSGNFSVRSGRDRMKITATGVHKGELTTDDFVDLPIASEGFKEAERKASSDRVIHRSIYRLDRDIGAVYHVHEPHTVALSRRVGGDGHLSFEGYSILKAFGLEDPGEGIEVQVLPDRGEARYMADLIDSTTLERRRVSAFVAQRHGLYVWGESTAVARRYIEALSHLMKCRVLEIQTGSLA